GWVAYSVAFDIVSLIHFALVITAYAANRKAKEMKAALVHEITESDVSSAHGTSTHGTSTHGFAGKS
ncbi:24444_t:CDS:2, partial [Gigaspora rosea]